MPHCVFFLLVYVQSYRWVENIYLSSWELQRHYFWFLCNWKAIVRHDVPDTTEYVKTLLVWWHCFIYAGIMCICYTAYI